MKVTVRAISASEAAHVVRRALGPVRAWDGLLEQMRRDDTKTYLGLRLTPYGQRRSHGCKRPIYLMGDVLEFIRQARQAAPHPANPGRIEMLDIEIDTALVCPWKALTVEPKRAHTVH